MKRKGFSALEVILITLMLSLVALVAIPEEIASKKRSQFAIVVEAAQSMRGPVEMCADFLGHLTGCGGDTTAAGKVAALSVHDGVVTAIGNKYAGQYSFILTPQYNSATNQVTWTTSGTCFASHAC